MMQVPQDQNRADLIIITKPIKPQIKIYRSILGLTDKINIIRDTLLSVNEIQIPKILGFVRTDNAVEIRIITVDLPLSKKEMKDYFGFDNLESMSKTESFVPAFDQVKDNQLEKLRDLPIPK